MTLADAIRKSMQDGRAFWRGPNRNIVAAYRYDLGRAFHRLWISHRGRKWTRLHIGDPVFSVDAALADDWQVEQTAPHGEGM